VSKVDDIFTRTAARNRALSIAHEPPAGGEAKLLGEHAAALAAQDEHDDEADGDCWNCLGDGGYPRCAEDCCPSIFGEENCDDPDCWRVCSVCGGGR